LRVLCSQKQKKQCLNITSQTSRCKNLQRSARKTEKAKTVVWLRISKACPSKK